MDIETVAAQRGRHAIQLGLVEVGEHDGATPTEAASNRFTHPARAGHDEHFPRRHYRSQSRSRP